MVLHAINAAQNFRQVEGFDGNAVCLQNLLAVANRVECRRPGSNRANAQITKAVHYTAYGGKPGEVFLELGRVGGLGVKRRNGIRNPILAEVVARRHLSAEAVPAE